MIHRVISKSLNSYKGEEGLIISLRKKIIHIVSDTRIRNHMNAATSLRCINVRHILHAFSRREWRLFIYGRLF